VYRPVEGRGLQLTENVTSSIAMLPRRPWFTMISTDVLSAKMFKG
jgi:hypothetical protein